MEPKIDNSNAFQFFCSWSGKKDSCLELFRMLSAGHVCKCLLTMSGEMGEHQDLTDLLLICLRDNL